MCYGALGCSTAKIYGPGTLSKVRSLVIAKQGSVRIVKCYFRFRGQECGHKTLEAN
jgi:hypothetical protein